MEQRKEGGGYPRILIGFGLEGFLLGIGSGGGGWHLPSAGGRDGEAGAWPAGLLARPWPKALRFFKSVSRAEKHRKENLNGLQNSKVKFPRLLKMSRTK